MRDAIARRVPLNQIAPAFHSSRPGFSSKESVSERGVPPFADTTAMRVFDAKYRLFPMVVVKAICDPSGDHAGEEFVP